MSKRLIPFIAALWLSAITAFADQVGGPTVIMDGYIQPAPGTLTTNSYSTGSGAANSNTVDHAIYADSSGGVAGGMTTNVYANGTGVANPNKVDHAIYADGAHELDPTFTSWLGTNTYIKTESDPVFVSWLGTNTYIKTESDPIWSGVSNTVTANAILGAWAGSSWSNSVAYLIAAGDTQHWNSAIYTELDPQWSGVSNTVTANAVLGAWAGSSWSNSPAYFIGSADTQRWNTAGLDSSFASNGVTFLNTNYFSRFGGNITGNVTVVGDVTITRTLFVTNIYSTNAYLTVTNITVPGDFVASGNVSGSGNTWTNFILGTDVIGNSGINTGNYQIAFNWVNSNSGGVAYVFSKTGAWDSAVATVTAMPTGNWTTAYDWVVANSGGVAYVFSKSNAWDVASTWVVGNSNGVAYLFNRSNTWDSTSATVAAMPTGNWSAAWAWITGNSNGIPYLAANNSFTGTNTIAALKLGTSTNVITNIVDSTVTPVSAFSNDVGYLVSADLSTQNWNTAYTWVAANSSGVASVFSRTGFWNTAYAWVIGPGSYIDTNVNGLVLSTNMLPASSNTYSLGSAAFPFASVWVATGSVHIGEVTLTVNANTQLVSSAPIYYQEGTNTPANTIIEGDPRLTDARTPLGHTQLWSTISSTPDSFSGYGITNNWIAMAGDAATLDGYTPEQLVNQQLTYYIWGSVAGPFTNPASKMAQIASPVGQSVWTSQVVNVTNGMVMGYASLNTNETPRILLPGLGKAHLSVVRDGNVSTRTMRCWLKVYESDMSTVVDSWASPAVAVPTTKTHIDFELSVTNETVVTDSGRYVVMYFEAVTGWVGTETITVYSQNGELTYVQVQGNASGIYATQYALSNEIARAVAAEAALNTRTTAWNQAVLDGTNWQTSVAKLITSADTQRWNSAVSDVTSNWATYVAITNVIPAISNAYDLGSLAFPFRDIYLGTNSVYIAGAKAIGADSNSTRMVFNKGVRLAGNAIMYEDMLSSASSAFKSGTTDISDDDTLGGRSYAVTSTTNANNDHLTFTFQCPHRRKAATHLDPHLHFYQTNADQTNCWFMFYAWVPLGTTNVVETQLGPASNQLVYTSGTMHQLASFPEITNSATSVSSILRIKLHRFGTRGTGAITVTDFDVHYEVDGFGSDQELIKTY